MVEGWPANHLCAVSKLSGLLGSRGLAHEIYAVFWVSSWSTDEWAGWKNCTIFWGRQGWALGLYPAYLCNFLSQRSGQGLQPLLNFLGESILGWLSGQILQLTSKKVDWSACGQRSLEWLTWCFCDVLVTVDWVDGGVKVWLPEGNLIVRTSTKRLSVWASELVHTHTCKHTPTWLEDKTTQTIQTHILNTTDRRSEWQTWRLWLIVGRPWRCLRDSVYDSMCERGGCLRNEHNMYTRSEDLVYDHNMVASITLTSTCKSCLSNEKTRWVWRLTGARRVNPSACRRQVKLSKEVLKLDAGQNFGGCCSHYNKGVSIDSVVWMLHIQCRV